MSKRRRTSAPTQASRADKYALYQKSVQEPAAEVAFLSRTFEKEFGRPAVVLREDFCGTFAVCCRWVRSRRNRQAIGVDLDPQPLAWGRTHNLAKLPAQARQRVALLRQDVRRVAGPKADAIAACNFSYCVFKTRRELLTYFRAARRNLGQQGLLVLDLMGGSEVIKEDHVDRRYFKSFVYLWEQARFNPITHRGLYHIHFEFHDDSVLRRAFTYDWRLWTIPELRELLLEAGFRRADVYWEGTKAGTNQGDGRYRRREHVPADPAWIAYIVGVK